ncbi:hypothetical protein C8F04DRAFT_1263052 [Mycena alexandri]|uniref:Uncharacterized protein n=1 Tax=Mycena alexandri TaxID=1745969 RepID=A0AAD6SRK6_9AGAR|nr:hypothetical protein C8F04DRAFT_1263052 [Mycena alexandri]
MRTELLAFNGGPDAQEQIYVPALQDELDASFKRYRAMSRPRGAYIQMVPPAYYAGSPDAADAASPSIEHPERSYDFQPTAIVLWKLENVDICLSLPSYSIETCNRLC